MARPHADSTDRLSTFDAQPLLPGEDGVGHLKCLPFPELAVLLGKDRVGVVTPEEPDVAGGNVVKAGKAGTMESIDAPWASSSAHLVSMGLRRIPRTSHGKRHVLGQHSQRKGVTLLPWLSSCKRWNYTPSWATTK